jgi:hypothetical protein
VFCHCQWQSGGDGARQFCCGRFRRYQPRVKEVSDTIINGPEDSNYRQDAIVNGDKADKAGRRTSGRAKARRNPFLVVVLCHHQSQVASQVSFVVL